MNDGKASEVFEPEDEDLAEDIPIELLQKETHITAAESDIFPELLLEVKKHKIRNWKAIC
jgi:hypothetical protein